MPRASRPLPVPVSPRIKTGGSRPDSEYRRSRRSTWVRTATSPGSPPIKRASAVTGRAPTPPPREKQGVAEVGEVSGLGVQLPLRNADRHPLFEQPQTVGVAPREGVGIAQAGGHGRPVGADVPGLAESAATLQPADRVVEGPPAEVEQSQRLTGGEDTVSLIQTLGAPQRFL